MNTFKDPTTGGDRIKFPELNGALLAVTVKEQIAEMDTAFGPSPAIRADVAVLDGAHRGSSYEDTLIFPKMLQSQLRGAIGDTVLGRLGQGNAKVGQSAPWMLLPATESDRKMAEQWATTAAARATADEEPF